MRRESTRLFSARELKLRKRDFLGDQQVNSMISSQYLQDRPNFDEMCCLLISLDLTVTIISQLLAISTSLPLSTSLRVAMNQTPWSFNMEPEFSSLTRTRMPEKGVIYHFHLETLDLYY